MLRRIASEPKSVIKEQVAAAGVLLSTATTPREAYLALAEIARRGEDGLPGVAATAPLTAYELRVFSQNGEDGVIAELARRCGVEAGFFVEFGAGAGAENNCALLADLGGWSGAFIEGDPGLHETLAAKYAGSPRVRTACELVYPSNVEELFARLGVPDEPDLVSIDVDGADLWIWRALERFRPRIVVIEYNAALGTTDALVQPADRTEPWDRTDNFGASIQALRVLGEEKGYRLVHTELTGNNAFFVRADLAVELPAADAVPLRGPNHFLVGRRHPPDRQGRRLVPYPG